jgi:hypothetical protein
MLASLSACARHASSRTTKKYFFDARIQFKGCVRGVLSATAHTTSTDIYMFGDWQQQQQQQKTIRQTAPARR